MDNQSSSDIVNEDSSIEATGVEALPPLPTTQATEPPKKVDSRFKDIGWRDGVELLTNAAELIPIPGLNSSIKTALELFTGTGKYSPGERLKEKQFQWVVCEIGKISHKIDILIQRLPLDEQIEAADVASIINAAMKASEKTADAKKRKLLKNAVVNAFDIEQYQAGLTLRLFRILENVEYGDVEMLRRVSKEGKGKYPAIKSLANENSSGISDIIYHHIEILDEKGLVVIWNHLNNQPLGTGGKGMIQITDLGEKFLNFVKEG